jgi:hypothetical protein
VTEPSIPDPAIVRACSGCATVVGLEDAGEAGHVCASRSPHLFAALRLRMISDVIRSLAEALDGIPEDGMSARRYRPAAPRNVSTPPSPICRATQPHASGCGSGDPARCEWNGGDQMKRKHPRSPRSLTCD